MICKYCNSEIQENMKFCPNCGKSIEGKSETHFESQTEKSVERFTGVVEDKEDNKTGSNNYQRFSAEDLREKTSNIRNEIKSGKSNNAFISIGTGVASLVCCCVGGLSVTLGLIAIIFGIISITSEEENHGLAVAGIICGAIGGLMGICIVTLAGIYTFASKILEGLGGI